MISPRQIEVLRFISECESENGFGPTIREIGVNLGITSTNGVSDHLRALRRKGFLVPASRRARALVLTKRGRAAIGVVEPVGYVAARDALVDAATEVASITDGWEQDDPDIRRALRALSRANDAWQVAQLRGAA